MQLNVPTNWDNNLLAGLGGLPILSFYGRLQLDVIGGGRPAAAVPYVGADAARAHIDLVHKSGYEFNYVLNSSCLGNIEYSSKGRHELKQLLDWLCEVKVDSVTVSIPYLIEIIKRNYPQLKISASVFSHIDSIDQAKMYKQLGVDEITIVQSYNRNVKFLRSLIKQVDCNFQIIVNNACLFGCPYRRYHANINSHSSNSHGEAPDFDYPVISCSLARLSYPAELIKSPWIRPEDMSYYEDIGLSRFKLSGRTKNTKWLKNAILAYIKRKSPDNFAELLSIPNGFGSIKRKNYHNAPEAELFIDNSELDEFIEYFLNKDCQKTSCNACGHCMEVAKRAVKTDDIITKQAIAGYTDLLEKQFKM